MITSRILQTATRARKYLDAKSRRTVIRFVRSRWNADGGVQGRDDRSDLYYTFFALMCMRVLHGHVPILRLWNYLRSFGTGESLDAVHLFCLIRMRALIPMSAGMRRRFEESLTAAPAESAYDLFFKVITAEILQHTDCPDEMLLVSKSQTTPNMAAAIMINDRQDLKAEALLMERFCEGGGFRASALMLRADLLSTATALVALRMLEADLEPVRGACLDFVESLWRDSGGFAGYAEDRFEDVEYTFYALLSIGCLME